VTICNTLDGSGFLRGASGGSGGGSYDGNGGGSGGDI